MVKKTKPNKQHPKKTPTTKSYVTLVWLDKFYHLRTVKDFEGLHRVFLLYVYGGSTGRWVLSVTKALQKHT